MEKFKKSVKKDQNIEFSALFGGVIENRLLISYRARAKIMHG